MNYKTEAVKQLANEIKEAGFRVFIAKTGSYGIYTNQEGSKVVSFQYDLGGFKFSGNYKSKSCGTGWGLDDNMTFEAMLNANAPYWATKGEAVKCTTLEQHLATYQKSSEYTEI
jgi:hypothetical protein